MWGTRSRLHTILQPRDAVAKFLEVVIELVINEFKMSPRRRMVKRCRKNVNYFLSFQEQQTGQPS